MKPTVLMLGWEFPPALNGGLGVASMGIATALGKLLPVNLILPRSQAQDPSADINIIGLDSIDLQDFWEDYEMTVVQRMQDLRLSAVQLPLSGYATAAELATEARAEREEEVHRTQPRRFFKLKELYGHDLPRRIIEYCEISLKIAEDLEFDVIHAHDWMTFIAGLEIKKKTGKPLVLHVHSTEYDRGGAEQKNWIYQLEKKAFEFADLIFPVSHYTAEIIRKHYDIAATKIQTIHNAPTAGMSYRKEKPFKDKLVSFVGRLAHQKGPELFFEMAMELLAQIDGVRFIVAGQGPVLEALMDRVSEARIGDKFHFAGFLSSDLIVDLLAMTDVLVMPSRSEPFGLVALEATQMGVPCVIPYQSGVSELLLHTPKFQAGEVEEMATKCLELLVNDNFHQEIVAKNQEAIKGFTWEKVALLIQDQYILLGLGDTG